MGQAMTREADRRGEMVTARDDLGAFEVLRELTNNGYIVAGGDDRSSGIRLSHDSAPDLILHADGRIEVPLGQARKSAIGRLVPGARRMSWRRSLAIVTLIVVLWISSLWFTEIILESM